MDSAIVNTRRQTTSYEPVTPPADLPTDLANSLNEYAPDRLWHVARYAEELVEHKEHEGRLAKRSDKDEIED